MMRRTLLLAPAAAAGEESPIACRMDALNAAQRARHREVTALLQHAVQEVRSVPGRNREGIALRLDLSPALVGEWIAGERLCCPFLDFELRLDREGAPLWLRLTGRRGVREFLEQELGLRQAGAARPSRP